MRGKQYYNIIFFALILILQNSLLSNGNPHQIKIRKNEPGEIAGILKKYRVKYLLYVSKKDFRLYVYNRHLKIETSFPVGYGYNRDRKAKLYEGDNRTPEGLYRIIKIYSLDHKKNSKSYRYLKDLNNLYQKAKDGYYRFDDPEKDIGKNGYGPRLFKINYPNKKDRAIYKNAVRKGLIPKGKNGKTAGIGFGISIHGNNYPPSIGNLCSSGCIMMHNRDIIKLDRYVRMGTPILISGTDKKQNTR